MTAASQCLSPEVFVEGLGLVWCEPTTVLTDWLLVALVLVLGWHSARGRARAWFYLMAVAFLVGGATHLLHHELSALVPAATRLQNCASSAALGLLAGLLVLGRTPRGQQLAEASYVAIAAGFVIAHLTLDSFWLTVAHQAVALLGAAALVLVQGRAHAYRWFLGSVVLGALCALIFAARISPHPWFNQNDLAHVVMVPYFIAMWKQLRA